MNGTALFLIRLGIAIIWALTPIALVAIGFLNFQRLKSLRAYMIVANLVVGALVTTPEILSQVLAAAALQACYEVAVLISRLRERQKRKRAKSFDARPTSGLRPRSSALPAISNAFGNEFAGWESTPFTTF